MANSILQQKLTRLPANPGVYIYKNSAGAVLYVGKAKVLKNRVRSYFTQSHDLAPRTQKLVSLIADLEYIICDTEVEALILENTLIKKYQPRYNILLRDDKNYQFIKIDYNFEIPQIYTVRKIPEKIQITNYKLQINSKLQIQNSKKNIRPKYFGPYTSGRSVRQMLSLMRYVLPYCANKKISARPCFYYHLGRCPGVCAGIISLEEYKKTLRAIERFLSGDLLRIQKELKQEMVKASSQHLFERAARLRDQVAAITRMLEQQKMISPNRESHDTVSVCRAGNLAAVNLFQIRFGKLSGKENFLLDNAKDSSAEELLRAFMEKYYLEASDLPPEINTQVAVPDIDDLAQALRQKLGKKVIISSPSRGRKRKLLRLGETNARDYLDKISQNLAREQAVLTRALFELKEKLHLPELPLRIECFDISNIQGTLPTGSMVVFENGKPKKSDYKRFAVQSLDTPNDFVMMEEILSRRLNHTSSGQKFETNPKSQIINLKSASWRLPDLLIVDGGRGQLNVAIKILKSKGLKIPVMGLAKRLEEIYLPSLKSTLRLPGDSPALQLLQRIRDEAHRFAITYHRNRRSKQLLES